MADKTVNLRRTLPFGGSGWYFINHFLHLYRTSLLGFSVNVLKTSENPYFILIYFQTFNQLFVQLNLYGSEKLEEAFNSRLDYEVKFNNFKRPMNEYRKSLKRLEGGFIIQEPIDLRSNISFRFINPSLVDFLLSYIKEDIDEVNRIAESVSYLSQLTTRIFSLFESSAKPRISSKLKSRILNSNTNLIKDNTKEADILIIIFIIYKYRLSDDLVDNICHRFEKINSWDFIEDNDYLQYQLIQFLNRIRETKLIQYLKVRIDEIFQCVIYNIFDLDEILDFMNLCINKFDVTFEKIIKFDSGEFLSLHLSEVLNNKIEEEVDWLRESVFDTYIVEEKHRELISIRNKLDSYGLTLFSDFSPFLDEDWEEIGSNNLMWERIRRDDEKEKKN